MGRPAIRDFDSAYLLSGIAKCAKCGGTLVGVTRDFKRERGRLYGCVYFQKRGATVCGNNLTIQQDMLDEAVRKAVRKVLDEQLISDAVDVALGQLSADQGQRQDRQAQLERELAKVKAAQDRLLDAIARGDAPAPLVDRLRTEEGRAKAIQAEIDGSAGAPR